MKTSKPQNDQKSTGKYLKVEKRQPSGSFSGWWVFSIIMLINATADDWPTFNHDSFRSARSSESLPVESLVAVWAYKSTVPPQPAWAGPAKWDAYAGLRDLSSMRNYDPVFHVIVVGTSLYFGSSVDDSVHCLDTLTGEEKWQFFTDAPVRIAPTYYEGKVYFGSDDGYAYCLEAETGQLIWKFNPLPDTRRIPHNGRMISLYPCRSGVLIDQGVAYFSMGMLPWNQSYLCAVDPETGKRNSKTHYLRRLNNVTIEGNLLASAERLIAPQGRIAPVIFQKSDGRKLGTLKGGGGCFVLLTPEAQVMHGPGNKTGWVTASNAKTRTEFASFKGGTAMVVDGTTAFLIMKSSVLSVDRNSRKTHWKIPTDDSYSIIISPDCVFVGRKDAISAYRKTDGVELWTETLEGKVFGMAIANGGLFASTDTGVIKCFRPALNPTSPKSIESGTNITQTPSSVDDEFAPVPHFHDDGLLSRWVFQKDTLEGFTIGNLAKGLNAELQGNIVWSVADGIQVIELDGDSQLHITDQIQKAQLPQQVFSVESWVRVDRTQAWGGIIGAIQDNGSFERGWLLGFSDSQFCLAVKGDRNQGGMTYLKSSTKFETEQWYHVAGTYDGKEMKVYVNGKLSASSKNQQGKIHYPEKTFYEIGVYHDENERYPMKGMLREIRLYDRLLNADEIADHAEDYHFNISEKTIPITLAEGPVLEFTSPGTAIVTWKTHHPVATRLSFSLNSSHEKEVSDSSPTTEHSVKLTGLRHNRIYHYVIHVTEGSVTGKTKAFECDTFFNFTAKNPRFNGSDYFSAELQKPYADVANEILNLSETRKGICLLIGIQDGRLAYELARRSELQVIGIDTDRTKVTQGRKRLAEAGVYGNKASFYYFENGKIPYIQQCANLIVVTNPQVSNNWNSFAEYLRPGSGKLLLQKSEKTSIALQSSADLGFLKATESWTAYQKNAKKGIGNWTHQYGTPANAAYAGESLQGASATTDFQVQWIGRPGPRAQPDRNGRKPSPLVANGRLYVQGLQRIISLDTYNGTILWSKEIPPLQRFNMPRDSSNWCADDSNLYAAIKNECWKFDGQTGRILNTIPTFPPEGVTEPMDWGYISVQNDLIIGSSVIKGTAFTEYWGGSNAGWYDATSGPATDKACSQNLFAIDSSDACRKWNYQDGIILNATITGGDSLIYFVECRHPKVKEHPSGRIGIPELWKNLFLVALDRESGNKKWERAIHPEQGIVVFYLAYGSEKLVLLSSGKNQYNLYTFDGNNGTPDWVQSFPWTKDNHGAHMARPAIVGQTIYVRPKAVDLITGKFLDIAMPGGGCGTYAATDQALFFRAGNVTVWDRNSGNTTSWNRLRPDCWLSTIPADGLLLSPEAGGGCSCGSWMETSIAFSPFMR